MDALPQKAFEALLKDVLPRLKEHLEAVELLDASSREADEDCRYLIAEASELLSLLRKWSGGESTPDSPDTEATSISATDEEMSDEDAKRLLAQMEGAEPQESSSEDMSDEDAQKLLASMDSDSESAPAAQADMSDEDAQRLLAEMDDASGSGGAENDDELSNRVVEMLEYMVLNITRTAQAPDKVESQANGVAVIDGPN